jgi:hypothetical protein
LISGTTTDALASVLDVFHARCRQAAGGFAERLAGDNPKPAARKLLRDRLLDATLHENGDHDGYVACLDLGPSAPHAGELIDRLRAFVISGDVARVGDLRFVWARRDAELTHYVALWTEGSLPLRTAFPERADAPGVEVPHIPRPEPSQRVLSAWQQAQAPLLVSYRAQGSAHELAGRYREQLVTQGFTVRSCDSSVGPAPCLLIESPRCLALALFTDDRDRAALVTLSPLR